MVLNTPGRLPNRESTPQNQPKANKASFVSSGKALSIAGTSGFFKVLDSMSEFILENVFVIWAMEDLNVQDSGVGPCGRSDIDLTYIPNRATVNPPKQPSRRISLSLQDMNLLLFFMGISLTVLSSKRPLSNLQKIRNEPEMSRSTREKETPASNSLK